MDFCVLNVLGYICYTIYCVNFYFNQNIINEYKARMSAAGNNAQVTVQGNDVAFAIHAVIMASFTLSQIGMYDTFTTRPPSRRVYALLFLAVMYCAIYAGGTWIFNGQIDFLGFLYVLGSIKIGVTIGKYVPQALLNQSRKSTVGWNVWNVILDLTGGLLSFLQLIGDCADMNDWSGITGNPAKIMLALVTICFDVSHVALVSKPIPPNFLRAFILIFIADIFGAALHSLSRRRGKTILFSSTRERAANQTS